jgi:hypothetical protein
MRLAPFRGDERSDAARGVSASSNLAAISIPDAHEYIGPRRGLERNELIAADAFLAVGDGAHRILVKRKRASAGIEHDEVVAESVHLAEGYGPSLHESA